MKMINPGFGKCYAYHEAGSFITHEGIVVWMYRKGQRVRFYDAQGHQHGPEHTNVVPAIVYAHWCGWKDPNCPEWLNNACRAEARVSFRSRRRRATSIEKG